MVAPPQAVTRIPSREIALMEKARARKHPRKATRRAKARKVKQTRREEIRLT